MFKFTKEYCAIFERFANFEFRNILFLYNYFQHWISFDISLKYFNQTITLTNNKIKKGMEDQSESGESFQSE